MYRMTINNQENLTVHPLDQSTKEFTKLWSCNSTGNDHKSQLPSWAYGRNHIEAESCTGSFNHRSFTPWSPRSSGMKIRSHSGLVSKEDFSTDSFGFRFDFGEFLFKPAFDQSGILLKSFRQGSLAGQAKLSQQSSDGSQAKFNSILTNQFISM